MNLSDPNTFSRAYGEHARSVQAVAYRVLGNTAQAQDVVQDVFLRVWRNPQKFDARRGELGSYLRLMARSRALDLWREGAAAGRAGDRLEVVVAQEQPRAEHQPAVQLERSATHAAVLDAMRDLPATQREALLLAHWGGLTANEIAHRAGVPIGTAKSRIRLGMLKLRERLARTGEELPGAPLPEVALAA